MPKKILLVDDDRNIIQGLKRVLHRQSDWQVQFEESGTDALELLKMQPFDAVVSDMRMPGMDGAELLQTVSEQFPQVIRIILSGYSDLQMILRSIKPVHRFLAKPCAVGDLTATLSRAFAAMDLLPDDRVKQMVAGVDCLPSSRPAYEGLIQELQAADSSLERLAAFIGQDVAMTAFSLKLISSAFFGLPQPVDTIQQVVSCLGLETIQKIAIDQKGFRGMAEADQTSLCALEALNRHSQMVGELAGEIIIRQNGTANMAATAAIAGVLHDIGSIVLLGFPELNQQIAHYAEIQKCDLFDAEYQAMGITHAEIGASLLGLWGLPAPVVQIVADHHRLPLERDDFSAAGAVRVSEFLVEKFGGFKPIDCDDILAKWDSRSI